MISVSAKSIIRDNTINAKASIDGDTVKTAEWQIYDTANVYGGEYRYIPMVSEQTIQCAQKKMLQNVSILPIQTREIQDATGGVNFEILSGVEANGI